MASAGRAVVFAGTTVVISMLGLLLVGIGWVGGVGVAVPATVLATMLASTTLLPALGLAQARVEMTRWRGLAAGFGAVALLGAAGVRPLAASAPCWLCSRSSRAWRCACCAARCRGARPHPHGRPGPIGWSRTIQRRPWPWVVAGVRRAVRDRLPGDEHAPRLARRGQLPRRTYTRQAYDLTAEAFGEGFNGPFLITAVPGPSGSTVDPTGAVEDLQRMLARTPGVATVTPALPDDPGCPRHTS